MKFLKNLFKKKQNILPREVITFQDDGLEKCGLCKKSIFPNTPSKTFPKSGMERKIYHMKCYRRLRKMGRTYQKQGRIPGM